MSVLLLLLLQTNFKIQNNFIIFKEDALFFMTPVSLGFNPSKIDFQASKSVNFSLQPDKYFSASFGTTSWHNFSSSSTNFNSLFRDSSREKYGTLF